MKTKARLSACIYIAIIFSLAMLPGTTRTGDEAPVDIVQVLQNFLHIPVYGGLAFTLSRAATARVTALSAPAAVGVVLAGVIVGLIDEWIQSHVPGRSASYGDLGLDVVGLLSVALALHVRGMSSCRFY